MGGEFLLVSEKNTVLLVWLVVVIFLPVNLALTFRTSFAPFCLFPNLNITCMCTCDCVCFFVALSSIWLTFSELLFCLLLFCLCVSTTRSQNNRRNVKKRNKENFSLHISFDFSSSFCKLCAVVFVAVDFLLSRADFPCLVFRMRT